jgi:thioesterase domain-containing protein
MANISAREKPAPPTTLSPRLGELQAILEDEIPICRQMGIAVHHGSDDGLVLRMPLVLNLNHQQTAFAGSLNALCTIAGWGSVFLMLKDLGREGSIVIRRSTIRYHEPVTSAEVFARALPVAAEARQYFAEMLDDKKQAKLDLTVEISGPERPLVTFGGSYVVILDGCAKNPTL